MYAQLTRSQGQAKFDGADRQTSGSKTNLNSKFSVYQSALQRKIPFIVLLPAAFIESLAFD